MKNLNLTTIALVLGVLASCSKSDEAKPIEVKATTPTATDDGKMSCRLYRDDSGSTTSYYGVFSGYFNRDRNSSTSVSAGTLKADAYTIDFSSNSYYLNLNNPIWTSKGPVYNASGSVDFPAFNYATTKEIPSYTTITSSATINKATGYTLTFDGVSCDSINVCLYQGFNATISKTLPGSATSYTFSSSALVDFAKGTSSLTKIMVEGINYESYTINDKKINFTQSRVSQKFNITIN